MIETELGSDGAFRIYINRPEKGNALSIGLLRDLTSAVSQARENSAKAIVLSSAGEKFFCTGADLSELRVGSRHRQHQAVRKLLKEMDSTPVPIITLVQGMTLGAGVALIALSDIVIASESTTIGFPEMAFGMYPIVVHEALSGKVHPSILFQWLTCGRTLDVKTAMDFGLISEMHPDEDFSDQTDERLGFYLKRLHALTIGLTLRQQTRDARLDTRLAAAETIIDQNLQESNTMQLLEEWIARMKNKC